MTKGKAFLNMKRKQILTGMAVLAGIAAYGVPAFTNPSFEQGTGGYWINNPSAARIDPGDSTDGRQSLGVKVVPGKTASIVQGIAYEPGKVYRIGFDVKGVDARLRLQVMLQGKKPLQFFNDPELKQEIEPGAEYKRITLELGPFPAKIGGDEVRKLMFYFNVTGEKETGKLNLDNISLELKDAKEKAVPKEKPVPKEELLPTPEPKPAAAVPTNNLLRNGSFEQGLASYWINQNKNVVLDNSTASHGRTSLKITPDDKKIDVAQDVPMKPGQVYIVRFDARTTTPEKGPVLMLEVLLRGKKPLTFFSPKGEQKRFAEPVPLGKNFKTYEYEIGPFPEDWRGTRIESLMFYWHTTPGANPGSVHLDNLRIEPVSGDQKKNEGITFQFPGDIRIFEKGFPLKVFRGAGNGTLKVRGVNALGKELFSRESKADSPDITVEIASPDYYAVTAEVIEDGKAVRREETTFAITTPLPADYYTTDQPAFGVWGGLNRELRRLGGAKWDRQLFFTVFQKKDFQPVEPTPEILAGKEPVKIIRCMNILNPFKKMTPVKPDEWADLETRLGKDILANKGLVQVWETQNEPMVGENFHGTMEDVMDIIRFESGIVRKIDPKAAIAGICVNPMNANQYNQYIGYYRNYGIGRLIDAVMLHPYIPGAQNPDLAGYVDTLNRLNRELSAIAGKPVPMYISEIGYSAKPGGEVTEYQQAAYLARVMVLNFTIENLKACVWHIGLWNEATSRRELDFALLRKQEKGSKVYQPKPSFAAWATASRMLYDAKLLRELDVGKTIRVWLFEKKGKPMLIAYSLIPETVRMQLALHAPSAEIVDMCGSRSTVKCRDGILNLELGEAPVYILGGALEQFAAGKFNALFSPETLATVPGGALEVKIHLPDNLSQNAALRLQPFQTGKGELSGKGDEWTLKLRISPDAAPGENDLFLMLIQNGVNRYIWQKRLQILPPLELTELKPCDKDGVPAIAFRLRANDPAQHEAKVEILAEPERVIGSGTARTGTENLLRMPGATVSARPARYAARLTLANGKSFRIALPVNPVPVAIPYQSDAISLPADKWPARGVYRLESGTYSRHAIKGEADRPTGFLRLACDEKYLYLSCDVRDKEYRPAAETRSLWDGDSLQIGISVPKSDMIRVNNDGIQETAYAEFGIAPDNRSRVWASMNLNQMPLAAPVPELVSKSSASNGVLRYRIAVPWETLNIRWRSGLPLRLSVLVNDRDRAGRHWLEWFGGIADGKDPDAYGEAITLKKTE